MTRWLLYGAYGFTGRLIATRALERGERPVLAGRDPARLEALAASLGLEHRAFDLKRPDAIADALADVDAVVHAAGPFVHTCLPMVEACLRTGTHYLDIGGEVEVLESLARLSVRAREAGIALLPAVGFDVVATDCAATCAVEAVKDATHLDIAFCTTSGPSPGTARSMAEHLHAAALERRAGRIRRVRRNIVRRVPFSDGPRDAVAVAWGDIATAYFSTGVPNIRTYMCASPGLIRLFGGLGRARPLLAWSAARRLLGWWLARRVRGPDEAELAQGNSHVWCRARDDSSGEFAVVELTTPNAYAFTAEAAVAAVRRVLAGAETGPGEGFLTPSLAFGHRFVRALPGVTLVSFSASALPPPA